MQILVLGSGLVGPAAAFNALSDPQVSQVTLCDMDQRQLDAAHKKLGRLPTGEKLAVKLLELNDQSAPTQLMTDFDAIVAALPKHAIPFGIRAAARARRPVVDLS